MSPSDEVRLPPGKADATTAVALLEQLANTDHLPADDVRGIISAATRLYAQACTQAGYELPPLAPDVATTDAMMLACALLRSQDLTPFDMAMWFSRGARHS
ncbi:MAG TPA: hypothetical protein VM846_06265 [Vicinamibacterales bacterium]|nr:hypothetical protein [Vicinamibacterales bacterium]